MNFHDEENSIYGATCIPHIHKHRKGMDAVKSRHFSKYTKEMRKLWPTSFYPPSFFFFLSLFLSFRFTIVHHFAVIGYANSVQNNEVLLQYFYTLL